MKTLIFSIFLLGKYVKKVNGLTVKKVKIKINCKKLIIRVMI